MGLGCRSGISSIVEMGVWSDMAIAWISVPCPHWDKAVSAEEVVYSGENVVRVGIKSEFPIRGVIEPPDVMEVERSIVDVRCVRFWVAFVNDWRKICNGGSVKISPTICGRCEVRSSQVDVSLKNCLPGLFGAWRPLVLCSLIQCVCR